MPHAFIRRITTAALATLTLSVTMAAVQAPAHAATTPRPNFQLPFACGESWTLATYPGHDDYDIDFTFTGGPSGGRMILAAAGGTVVKSGWDAKDAYGNPLPPGTKHTAKGLGYFVIIDHGGGWTTVYGHMVTWPQVTTGQTVAQGEYLGNVGETGAASGDHLHYEQLDDTLDPSKTRGVGDKTEAYFDGVASGITTDGDPNTGPLYVGGAKSPNQYRTSNNCGLTGVGQFADMDGDGRDEMITLAGTETRAYHNVGGWTATTYLSGSNQVVANGFDPNTTKFADIDGDGKDEIIAQYANGDVYAYHNISTGWGTTVYDGAQVRLIAQGFTDAGRTKFADIDADHKDEIVFMYADGNVAAYHNISTGWGTTVYDGYVVKTIAQGFTVPSQTFFADIESDGMAEIATWNGSPVGAAYAYRNIGGWVGTTFDGTIVKSITPAEGSTCGAAAVPC